MNNPFIWIFSALIVVVWKWDEMFDTNPFEDMAWWVWAIIGIVGGLILIRIGDSQGLGDKKCAWCNDAGLLKFKSGEQGSWFWEYRNQDGSKDKRVKDNTEKASYHSEFECENCSATTKFDHYVDESPGPEVKVSRRILVTKGKGERKGTDWENSESQSIDTKRENRKGDS